MDRERGHGGMFNKALRRKKKKYQERCHHCLVKDKHKIILLMGSVLMEAFL